MGRRFHFESFWPKVPGFFQVVQEAWTEGLQIANPFRRVTAKPRSVAGKLGRWSDQFIGDTKLQILVATELILRLDVAMEEWPLSPDEHVLRRLIKKKLLGLSALERLIVRQHSRLMWLKEGDANTRFFHIQASHRQRKNLGAQLKVDGGASL